MCIALPCEVMAVIDEQKLLIAVAPTDGGAREVVSAALVVTPEQSVAQLIGNFVLIHAGFAISLISEAEARSRQQVFAALADDNNAIDLGDFYATATEASAK